MRKKLVISLHGVCSHKSQVNIRFLDRLPVHEALQLRKDEIKSSTANEGHSSGGFRRRHLIAIPHNLVIFHDIVFDSEDHLWVFDNFLNSAHFPVRHETLRQNRLVIRLVFREDRVHEVPRGFDPLHAFELLWRRPWQYVHRQHCVDLELAAWLRYLADVVQVWDFYS